MVRLVLICAGVEWCSSCRGLSKCVCTSGNINRMSGAPCLPSSRWPPAPVHRCSSFHPALTVHGQKEGTIMSTTNETTTTQAATADTPQTVPVSTLTPEAVGEALRALRAQIGDTTPLTIAQPKSLRGKIRASNPILPTSINIFGALDNLSQAVGQPAYDVR